MRVQIDRIDGETFQIRYDYLNAAEVYLYLLIGEDRAMLIDTGYSTTPVREIVGKLTDRDVFVVNTHGHCDHIGADSEFEVCYLAAEDLAVAHVNCDRERNENAFRHVLEMRPAMAQLLQVPALARELEQSFTVAEPVFRDLPGDMCFDLGGRTVRAVRTPGHTRGSIVLMDVERGYLFSGDTLCDQGLLLSFEESADLEIFRNTLRQLKTECRECGIERIFPGHHSPELDTGIIDEYETLVDAILEGDITGMPGDVGTASGLIAGNGRVRIVYHG